MTKKTSTVSQQRVTLYLIIYKDTSVVSLTNNVMLLNTKNALLILIVCNERTGGSKKTSFFSPGPRPCCTGDGKVDTQSGGQASQLPLWRGRLPHSEAKWSIPKSMDQVWWTWMRRRIPPLPRPKGRLSQAGRNGCSSQKALTEEEESPAVSKCPQGAHQQHRWGYGLLYNGAQGP